MRGALWVLMIVAFSGLSGTFVVEASYASRAQKVQVVRIDKTQHSAFGPVAVDVGDPVLLLVDDSSIFLKNKTATGLPMLDAEYVKQHGDSALQLKTIDSIISLARLGCIFSTLVAGIGLFLLKRLQLSLPAIEQQV